MDTDPKTSTKRMTAHMTAALEYVREGVHTVRGLADAMSETVNVAAQLLYCLEVLGAVRKVDRGSHNRVFYEPVLDFSVDDVDMKRSVEDAIKELERAWPVVAGPGGCPGT